ncbi:hypothetical protein [Nocardia sp. NPDC004722]
MRIDRRGLLAGLAVAGALATAPLTVSIAPATAELSAAAHADPQTYDLANCDQPEFKDDKDFQDWCTRVLWDKNPSNPANPNSLLNPNNPLSPLNPIGPMNPSSPMNRH